jgi:hypothetical protein
MTKQFGSQVFEPRVPVGFCVPAVGDHRRVQTAAEILIGVFLFLIVLVVVGSFVWAAKRDGEEDMAVQKRLGIRRKTRLGR